MYPNLYYLRKPLYAISCLTEQPGVDCINPLTLFTKILLSALYFYTSESSQKYVVERKILLRLTFSFYEIDPCMAKHVLVNPLAEKEQKKPWQRIFTIQNQRKILL